jgi:phosphonate transport system ATP-binding protein
MDVSAASGSEIRMIRRQIGMIFQQFNLVKRSPVITNVLSGRLGYVNTLPSLFSIFSSEDRKRAMDSLEQVGLADKAHVRADSLSGGQQQRVGIARALMQEPKLMLAHTILKYLEQLNKERGITVLCSLHFLDLVHRYATRAIALKDGELVFEGLPKEIDDAQFKTIYGKEAERISII